MYDTIDPVQASVSLRQHARLFRPRSGTDRRLVVLAMGLLGCWGLARGQPALAEEQTNPSETRPGAAQEPPAAIEGFRNARFGMSEEQVRQAIRKDFPAAPAKPTSALHPAEKTTVLS